MALLLTLSIGVEASSALAASDGTQVSLSVPAEAQAGARVVAQGRVAGLEGRGSIQAQSLRNGSWRAVARLEAEDGRFRLPLRLPSGGKAVTLRVVVLLDGHRVATSPTRRVRLAQPHSAPTAPISVRLPNPATSTPAQAAIAPPSVEPVPPPEPEPPIEPPDSLYWGAWINPGTTAQPAPINATKVSEFEDLAGKPLSVLESYSAFAVCSGGSCSSFYDFPAAQLNQIRSYGAVPLFTWASESSSGELSQPNFQLADIIDGDWDGYITQWATEAREWGHPFFLRFDWEMNGNWYPWSESVNGNQPGEYAEAWRHVHDIFSAVGATNATWVWCPFVNPNGNLPPIADLYPGDEYVDWTGLDGYNHGTSKGAQWRSFSFLFGPQYKEITETIAPGKPMLIPEVASAEQGGSKAEWITNMFEKVPADFPAVRGLLWFDYEENGYGYPLELSPAAASAFAAAVADPRYLANTLGGLATSPIPPP